jgi:hypothetical protein
MSYCDRFSVNGRTAKVTTMIVGKYGDKWREVDISDASHFCRTGNKFFHGRPVLAPQEWKVLCWVERDLVPKKPPPVLRVVRSAA